MIKSKLNLWKNIKKLFQEVPNDSENNKCPDYFSELKKIQDIDKLNYINDSISSLRDTYIARRSRIDSRLGFALTFATLTLSISIALYSYFDTIFNFSTAIPFFFYVAYQVLILLYILFLYFPKHDYVLIDEFKMLQLATYCIEGKEIDSKGFLVNKISNEFISMNKLDKYLDLVNFRFKILFSNIMIIIFGGIVILMLVINLSQKKSSSLLNVEEKLSEIHTSCNKTNQDHLRIIIDNLNSINNSIINANKINSK